MTHGELSGLVLAGDLAGVSMESIGKAATKSDVAFAKAAGGSRTAIAAFNDVGMSVESLNNMTAAERFSAITDAIAKLPSEVERAAAAVKLFGRSGAELLPLFAGGAAGIAAATEEAKRFGLALTSGQTKNVEEMRDAFTRATAAIKGVVGQIDAFLAPAIAAVTTKFANMIGDRGGANIGQAIGEGILQGAKFLAVIGDWLIANLSSTFAYIASVGESWSAVWADGQRVADYFSAVARALHVAFLVAGAVLAPIIQRMLQAAAFMGERMGFDTSNLDSGIKQLQGFSAGVGGEISKAGAAWAENAGNALFGRDAATAGEAIAGPLVTGIDEAIAKARAAAGMIDTATATTLKIEDAPAVKLDTTGVKEAVRGIDSRSREGITEMFRIMRGDGGNTVADKQLEELKQINDKLDDDGVEVDEYDLAPSAGV